MALTEVQPQQRFYRITCDGACGRSVHVTAADEQAALDRVRGLWRWQADEQGQRCPTCSGVGRADASLASALAAFNRDGGVSVAERQAAE